MNNPDMKYELDRTKFEVLFALAVAIEEKCKPEVGDDVGAGRLAHAMQLVLTDMEIEDFPKHKKGASDG